MAGFEPSTSGLRVDCSATVLPERNQCLISCVPDGNEVVVEDDEGQKVEEEVGVLTGVTDVVMIL